MGTEDNSDHCLAIEVLAEDDLLLALGATEERDSDGDQKNDMKRLLLVLARVFDAVYLGGCKIWEQSKKGQENKGKQLGTQQSLRHEDAAAEKVAVVDLKILAETLLADPGKVNDRVVIDTILPEKRVLVARWEPVHELNFSGLRVLNSLRDPLPGERPIRSLSNPKQHGEGQNYAGIGGGGGSDIISASVLGHLLHGAGKDMDLLISTRTWLTGSQGKPGSGNRIGERREVFEHGGHALNEEGDPVPGTYRVKEGTHTSGRDLETIPLTNHKSIFLTLDPGPLSNEQTDKTDSGSPAPPSPLPVQYQAILRQHSTPVRTIITVDTGGDVFFPGTSSQDFHVQSCLSTLPDASTLPSLTTAILCPGVDAPASSPSTALRAKAVRYIPSPAEKVQMLQLLTEEYCMDGRDETRFGKTTLCLQHTLRGELGWQVLNLPRHVVETGRNPWGVFEWVSEGMAEILLVGTRDLVSVLREEALKGEGTGK